MNRLWHYLKPRPELLPSKAAYARWARSYPPLPHNRFMELEQATLLKMLPDLTNQKVLDLGCGTGRWGKIALERGASQVISLDSSPHMLRAGRPNWATEGMMSQIPLKNGCVEVVICGLAVGHITTPRLWSTLSEIKRVLVAGGVALLSDVHPTQMWHGGQRTFEDDGKQIAVEHYIHSYADYHHACQKIGLVLAEVEEVSAKLGEPPVLLAVKLQKP